MSITPYKHFSARNLEFGRLQPRGMYHFSNIMYKGEPLIIETPPLITPNGINADEARNWMDVDLNINNDVNHQSLYNMFKTVDDRCINECINNRSKWFPRSVDNAFIEEEYKSPLTAGWGNEPASLRIEIVPERPEDLVDNNGVPISPEEVTALSSVVIQMQLLGVWASEKYLGCHWRALVVRANLDHEKQGRRRSDSPRRISPPPTRPPRALASRSEQPSSEPKAPERAERAEKTERAERVERVERVERAEKQSEQPKVETQLEEPAKEPVKEPEPKEQKAPATRTRAPIAQRSDTKAKVQEMLKRFQLQREMEANRVKEQDDNADYEEIDEDELERRMIEYNRSDDDSDDRRQYDRRQDDSGRRHNDRRRDDDERRRYERRYEERSYNRDHRDHRDHRDERRLRY